MRPVTRRTALAGLAATLALATTNPALADDPAAIMARVDEQRRSDTRRATMVMRIYPEIDSNRGMRELGLLNLGRGVDESFIEFRAPRNIAGLRVLDLDGAVRVFFPSTGRVRNISGRARQGSVGGVGGDFTYEDMGGAGFATDYTDFQMEGSDGQGWVISGRPRARDSAYDRLVFHIARDTLVPLRIDYMSGGQQAKQLEARNIRQVGGRHVAMHLIMRNYAEGSRTEIHTESIEWDVPVDAARFHPNRFHR